MSEDLHPHIAALMKCYARDLAQVTPSPSLDARVTQLVASPPARARPPMRRWRHPFAWAAAASLAVLTISAGILIGMRLERGRDMPATTFTRAAAQPEAWSLEDLGMWPSDSVALTIPAEYSAQGTLVAVNPKAQSTGKRYWIDVVVSNDGTVRIENIVPADPGEQQQAENHGHLRIQ